ncbi:MAG: twin-arginine translocation signal domain-containing protein [Acidobacteriia bacterium]|nr:twin-arginine translocation signal domain-containing protein [Terriglobia bacterium]
MANTEIDRRDFLKTAAVAGSAALTALAPAQAQPSPQKNMIGIQVGAISFLDEGVEPVLDIFQERGHINTLFLAVFTYGRGIAGRQVPGQPLPDHGKQEYDLDFHGGNFATPHSQYYRDTALRAADTRAPDHPGVDIITTVAPAAKKRGMRTILWAEDVFRRDLPNIDKLLERDLHGKQGSRLCFNNPNTTNFLLGLVEDYARSYDVDGIMWCSERMGPLNNAIRTASAEQASCFCEFCQKKAQRLGINMERARAGYLALETFLKQTSAGQRPVDGCYVTFWRILLRYPDILAWETFWNDSLRETYQALHSRVKSVKPELLCGWHIFHNNSFSPYFRAEQDLQELAKYSDFLKIVMYHNCAGPRMASYIDGIHKGVFADFPKQELLEYQYRVLDYKERSYEEIPYTGFSSDYVYRESKRAVDGAAGTKTLIWPGIDIDIPTEANQSKCTPLGTKDAVMAAFRAGAPGVVLSRKYSEMRLANLSGAGEAIKELKLA